MLILQKIKYFLNHINESLTSHWPLSVLSTLANLFNAAVPIIIARLLSTEEVGIQKTFFLYLSLTPALSLSSGLLSSIPYWTGISKHSSKYKDYTSSVVTLMLFVALFLKCLFLLASNHLSQFFHQDASLIYLFGLATFSTVLYPIFEEMSIAAGHTVVGSLYLFVFDALRATISVAIVLLTRSLYVFLAIHTFLSLLKVICAFWLGSRLKFFKIKLQTEHLKPILRYSLPVSIAWIAGIFIKTADQVWLSRFLSYSDFAIYSVGCFVIPPLMILETSVVRIIIPQLSEYLKSKDLTKAREVYQDGIRSLASLVLPAVGFLLIFSNEIIVILFSEKFAASTPIFQLHSLYYLTIIIPYDAIARATGDSLWILRTFAIISVSSFLLSACGYLLGGTPGAIGGILLSTTLLRLLALRHDQLALNCSIREIMPGKEIAKVTTATAIIAVITMLIKTSYPSIAALFYLIMGGFIAYLANVRIATKGFHSLMVLTQSFKIGGIERAISNQLAALNDQMDCIVFAYNQHEVSNSGRDKGHLELGQEVEIIGNKIVRKQKKSGFSVATVMNIFFETFRSKVKIIHVHDLGSLIYATFVKLLFLNQIKIIYTVHSLVHLQKGPKYHLYESLFAKFVDFVIFPSRTIQKQYSTQKKSSIIPHCVKIAEYPRRDYLISKYGLPDIMDKSWVLCLGRIDPVKNQSEAISIFNNLSHPNSVLLVVGPITDKEYYTTIYLESERIIFVNGTGEPEEWLIASNVLLSASKYEGAPMIINEGLVYPHLHILVSNISGHQNIDDRVKTYQNTGEAVALLHESLNAPAKDSANSLKKECYDLSEYAKRHLEIYKLFI